MKLCFLILASRLEIIILFMVYLVPYFCAFWGVILLFKIFPKCIVEVLSSVPECKKAMYDVPYREKYVVR